MKKEKMVKNKKEKVDKKEGREIELTGRKKEVARDLLALGSWVFYILVVARALIAPYRPFSDQVIFAAIFLLIITIFYKKFDSYSARAFILVVFTIMFYDAPVYNWFAILAMIGLIISSYFVGNTRKDIIKGLIIGLICTLAANFLANITYLRYGFF